MWSKKAKKIFFEILEDFSKVLLKIFEKSFSWQSLAVGLWGFLVQTNVVDHGLGTSQTRPTSQKNRFFQSSKYGYFDATTEKEI